MNTSCNVYRKHLDLSKRIQIESSLNERKKFTEIANLINKSRKTVSDEIKRHRIFQKSSRYGVSPKYDMSHPKTTKAPFVCNGCSNKTGCKKTNIFITLQMHKKIIKLIYQNLEKVLIYLLKNFIK